MSKLAIIDLDGVVANSNERFALAEKIATEAFAPGTKDYTSAYWHNVFMPERVILDVPIDGAYDALNTIEKDHELLFLTSRPEHMREATVEWLFSHRLSARNEWPVAGRKLFMKPASMQYIKTVIWKAGLIHTLACAIGATEVLVIDDETMNLDELQKYQTPFAMKYYTSLAMEDHEDLDDIRSF